MMRLQVKKHEFEIVAGAVSEIWVAHDLLNQHQKRGWEIIARTTRPSSNLHYIPAGIP